MLEGKIKFFVMPVNPGSESGAGTGIHKPSNTLDSGFRRNDVRWGFRPDANYKYWKLK